MRRFYSLALSDPSPLESAAVLVGLVASVAGFFFILVRLAYLAGVYASPITPYGSVQGYVSGFNQPIPIPSEAAIRESAARSFLHALLESKLELWLLFIVSLFITVYPLARRLKDTMLPATGVAGRSPGVIVWAGLIPVVLVSLGYVFVLLVMTMAVYRFYFDASPDRDFTLVTGGLSLYMIAATVLFYDALASTDRPDLGVVLGFLVGLGIDRIGLSALGLVEASLGIILAGLLFLALAIQRRWLAL